MRTVQVLNVDSISIPCSMLGIEIPIRERAVLWNAILYNTMLMQLNSEPNGDDDKNKKDEL
jgi:hypothetical protein